MKVFTLLIVLTFSVYANSIEKIENEIRDYTNKEDSFFLDSEDSKIKELFSDREENENLSSSKNDGYKSLPDSIRVSKILSKKLVRNSKSTFEKYTVKTNENLAKVARKFNTSIAKIKKVNRLKSEKLKNGQVLKIPVTKFSGTFQKVTKVKVFTLPVVNARISSRYGSRKDPFNHFKKNYHTGVDFSAEVGTAVIASRDGVVEFTGRNGGYGNTVTIRHRDGYRTAYAHCADIFVKPGEFVKMGKVIAMVGRTGTATGAHLHFEVTLNGKYIDPEKALRKVEIYSSKRQNSIAKL